MQINKQKLFGTDGIRGTPGVYPLTDEMISKIGNGIARYVLMDKGAVPKVVIGKDTRQSGHQIETILANAIKQRGIDVFLVGTITTPGLSFLTKDLQADMGIMISASHNKATDNGIKFFNAKGNKLSCREEEGIEEVIFDSLTHEINNHIHRRSGKVHIVKNAQAKYVKFLTSTLEGMDLKGICVALDCASGAASPFAKQFFRKLGAKVYCINDTPKGDNINIGGAIEPGFIKSLVSKAHADIGIAVDGDGDRGILVDDKGRILDGDCIIAIIARYLLEKNRLPRNTIVGTVMSNYGLKVSLEAVSAKMITTPVGDKHVLEALLENNLNLGGEQSGHIIFLDYLSTPDGLLTALQVLKVMRETGAKLSELSQCITKYPQVLVNVKVREKKPFEEMPLVAKKLRRFTEQIKDEGRILLRYSGTENLARVMVEGKSKELINNIANSLAEEIREEIGIKE